MNYENYCKIIKWEMLTDWEDAIYIAFDYYANKVGTDTAKIILQYIVEEQWIRWKK